MKILTGKSDSISDLADMLSGLSGRKVIDKTGLTGHADITLKWSDDVAAEAGGPNVISIFTAIERAAGPQTPTLPRPRRHPRHRPR
jgi:uncharacterized protein (TIGR03435 family)